MALLTRKNLLAVYNIVLSIGAIQTGILMIQSNSGVFTEYPKEWIGKIPFNNWVVPGVIVFMIFGLGNLAAAITVFLKNDYFIWITSAGMGALLFISIFVQRCILGEWYMPDNFFFIISVIQLYVSYIGYIKSRKVVK